MSLNLNRRIEKLERQKSNNSEPLEIVLEFVRGSAADGNLTVVKRMIIDARTTA